MDREIMNSRGAPCRKWFSHSAQQWQWQEAERTFCSSSRRGRLHWILCTCCLPGLEYSPPDSVQNHLWTPLGCPSTCPPRETSWDCALWSYVIFQLETSLPCRLPIKTCVFVCRSPLGCRYLPHQWFQKPFCFVILFCFASASTLLCNYYLQKI